MRNRTAFFSVVVLLILVACDPTDDAEPDGGSGDAAATDASGELGADGALADAAGPGPDTGLADSAVPDPDTDAGAAGMACETRSGSGTQHSGTITADETWAAADGPHVVTAALHVTGATLTLEPCVVVRMREGVIIDVRDGGELVAHGEYVGVTRRPIVFGRDDAEPWGSLRVFPDGMIDLEHVDLIGGGDHGTAVSNGGTLIAEGNGGNVGLTENLRAVDVVIEDSAGFGVNLLARAAFTDNSDSLVIRNAGNVPSPSNVDTRYPIYVAAAAFPRFRAGRSPATRATKSTWRIRERCATRR